MSDQGSSTSVNPGLGFRQSAQFRLMLTAIFFVLAASSILLVGKLSATDGKSASAIADEVIPGILGEPVRLTLESTFPRETTLVIFDQVEVLSQTDDTSVYLLPELRPDSQLFISVQSANFFGEKDEAVRVHLRHSGHDHEAILWGRGDLTRTDAMKDWFPGL